MSPGVIIPNESDFVELADTKAGKLFRKMILPMGQGFVHPSNPLKTINVDQELAESLVRNFKDGICDTVQFPMVNEKNQHVEDPSRNLGQVIDLSYDDEGVWATLDVRKNAEDIGTTILGASAMMHLDYSDTRTGKKVGPTLLHVAATNRPYLTKLAPYQEIVSLSASSDIEDDNEFDLVELSASLPGETSETKGDEMTRDEMIAALRDTHGIDVAAMQHELRVGKSEVITALSNVLTAADDSLVSLSSSEADELTLEDVATGVVELARNASAAREENVALSAKVTEFETAQATADVETAISEGRILPSQREPMLELRLSNADMFNRLVPNTAVVSLSEDGVTTHDETPNAALEAAEAEIDRLVSTLGN